MKDISTQLRIGVAVVIWSFLLIVGVSMSSAVQAQLRPYRISDRQISDLLRRLDQDSGRFRNGLDSSLDRSRRDGTRAEDNINAFVRDFDSSVGHLRNQFNGRRSVAADVEDVLQKAATIDDFMERSRATSGAGNDWSAVRSDLDELATAYGVTWQWNRRANVNDGYGIGNRGNGRRTGRNWDNYGNYGGSFDLRQTALNAGYNEGLKDGTDARQRGRSIDFSNQSSYRSAMKDYSSRLGDRSIYQRYFREAYETGFNDAYNPGLNVDNNVNNNVNNQDRDWNRNRRGRNWDRYGNYGGSFDLRQTALNAGYNEGIKEGRKDRGRGSSDFRNNSAYREATTDYSSKLGDRELYRRYYREGYENGYNDGVNGN
jgi:hypothetical protein